MGSGPRWTIGDVTVSALVERRSETPLGFLPSASQETIAAHRGWLRPWALGEDDQLRFVIQALCLEVGGQRIVVDTCVGPRRLPEIYAWIANDGSFVEDLGAAGFGRDDVDLVICTHLHFDHVGWNTIREDGGWVPTFRRARYLISRPEYDHWRGMSEQEHAAGTVFNFDDAVTPLFTAGQVDLVDLADADHRVNEAVRLVATPGHSPGHVSVRITSRGEDALITGDCAHHPVQFAEPDWYSTADIDAGRANATRRRLVREFTDTGTLIIGTHFPPPGAGHLVTDGGRVRFRPVPATG
jgi:glyoxylase-like metal-dependent hydrolase (beta-lactamase superfamily II)